MSERFILLEEDLYNFRTIHFVVGDIKHRNGRYTRIGPLVDILNEQYARIHELEEENTQLCNFNLHNILDKKNKEINQLKKELQSWKDTAEALQDQLSHHLSYMGVVTDE